MIAKSPGERKKAERVRKRALGLRPFEIWVHPTDWPFVKELVGRFTKARSKQK